MKTVKKIAYSGLVAAVLTMVKYLLSFLPNVELVSPLIAIFAVTVGLSPTLIGTVAFCFLDTVVYGFYPLVFTQYIIHFPLLAIVSYFVSKNKEEKSLPLAITVGIFALLFWIETPIINRIAGLSLFLPTLLSGEYPLRFRCLSAELR